VVSYGGSFSGEHGDGQQRGELLPKMFGPELVSAFGQMKTIFDPDGRMNPGKVVAPYRLDEHLRLGVDYNHGEVGTHFRYPHDDGSFGRAVLRCVGVGKCRREGGGVMCPSYQVTREEEHSTRGRARLLFEMLDGTARGGTIGDGWRSQAVHDALDLCLACKGCKTDCPVNVDMATYKAEFLSQHYAGRLRPLAHYSMGWLPVAAAAASYVPRLVNALTHGPGLARLVKAVAGVEQRRQLPVFAEQTFQGWFRTRVPGGDGHRGQVLLWPDTFTNRFHPHIARRCGGAGVGRLAGRRPRARRVLRADLDLHRPAPHRQEGAGPHRPGPAPAPARRHPDPRARAELYRGVPLRCRRAVSRRPRHPAAAPADRHPR
jgi:ferredoxin